MKNIITAIGNPILNNQLKKNNNINIIKNDIKYKDELLNEIKNNKNIDFIILSEIIKGKLKFEELIKQINLINSQIKIIILLLNEKQELINKLNYKNIYKIYINNKVNINNIIKDIEDYNNYNQENYKIKNFSNLKNLFFSKLTNKKIKKEKYCKTKIISIIGISQSGKTSLILLFIKLLKNKKILIIDCDTKFNEIQLILNSKNKLKKEIIKITNNLDILNLNLKFNNNYNHLNKKINYYKNNYDYIFIDNNLDNIFFNKLLELSNNILFLIEPNLLKINKSKILIEDKIKNNKNIINKTKIIINKNSKYNIESQILYKIFDNYKIIGKIIFSKCIFFRYKYLKNIKVRNEIKKIINNI